MNNETLEPPAPVAPFVTQDRSGETTLVLRIRCNGRPDMPAGNLIGTTILTTVLKNELDAEGIPYSYLKGVCPLNASTYMLSTSEPSRAVRRLAAVLESHHLGSGLTVHCVDRRRNLLVCLRAIPYSVHADAATLDDLLAEIESAARNVTVIVPTLLYPAGRLVDYILDAVTRAETAAAKNQNPPGPDDGRVQTP